MEKINNQANEADFLLFDEIEVVRDYLKKNSIHLLSSFEAIIQRRDSICIDLVFGEYQVPKPVQIMVIKTNDEKLIMKLFNSRTIAEESIALIIKTGFKKPLERLFDYCLESEDKNFRNAIIASKDQRLIKKAVIEGEMNSQEIQMRLYELGYTNILELYFQVKTPFIFPKYAKILIENRDIEKIKKAMNVHWEPDWQDFSNMLDWCQDDLMLSSYNSKFVIHKKIYDKLKKRNNPKMNELMISDVIRDITRVTSFSIIKDLLTHHFAQTIKYLRQADLKPKMREQVEKFLLKTNDLSKISDYLYGNKNGYALHSVVINSGNVTAIAKLLNQTELDFATQDSLYKLGNLTLLIMYTNKYIWHRKIRSQLSLLAPEIINAILASGGDKPSDEFVFNTKGLSHASQMETEFAHDNLMIEICLGKLQETDFDYIIETKQYDHIALQLERKKHLSDKHQLAIAALHEERLSRLLWAEGCHCSVEAEAEMFRGRNFQMIYDYLKFISPAYLAQFELAKWGNVDLILRALNKRNDFHSAEAQIELFKLGNKKILLKLVQNNEIDDEACDAMLEYGDKDVIREAGKRTTFQREIRKKISALGLAPKEWKEDHLRISI